MMLPKVRRTNKSPRPAKPASACGCRVSSLLDLAIELIDWHPPRCASSCSPFSAAVFAVGSSGDSQYPTCAKNYRGIDDSARILPSSNSSVTQKNGIVHNAIQAYDLLVHAASLSSVGLQRQDCKKKCSFINGEGYKATDLYETFDSSEELQNSLCEESVREMADVYRALLVTCCLLLETLPQLPISSHPDEETQENNQSPNPPFKPFTQRFKFGCPNLEHINCFRPPILDVQVKKQLLSTARRSVLLLQALERVSVAQTVIRRHHSTFNAKASLSKKSFYEGGDEIHDYDRSISDLYSNYDWHDDGFLPLSRYMDRKVTNSCHGSLSDVPGIKNSNSSHSYKTSLLQECCYLPYISWDPPSSRREKRAWTRDFLRGERIVSLRSESYRESYWDQQATGTNKQDNRNNCKEVYAGQDDKIGGASTMEDINSAKNAQNIKVGFEPNSNSKFVANSNNFEAHRVDHLKPFFLDSSTSNVHIRGQSDFEWHELDLDDGDVNEGSLFFDLSPTVLAQEENTLLNIMLLGNESFSHLHRNVSHKDNTQVLEHLGSPHPNLLPHYGKRPRNNQRKNKKKRQRHKRRRAIAQRRLPLSVAQDSVDTMFAPISHAKTGDENASIFAMEGFLLLLCQGRHSFFDDKQGINCYNTKEDNHSEETNFGHGGRGSHQPSNNEPYHDDTNHSLPNASLVDYLRCYVRLYPSGWLSIEDRSIRPWNVNHNKHGDSTFCSQEASMVLGGKFNSEATSSGQNKLLSPPLRSHKSPLCLSLPHRIRYWDYFIQPQTTCLPLIPAGSDLFRFSLRGTYNLGSSSLDNSTGVRAGDGCVIEKMNSLFSGDKTSSLVFGVDYETGGTFADGFEWVTALSGAARNAKILQENIISEWGLDVTKKTID